MKALVLSGGTGVRLRPVTYSMPKQLIPIANKPVLVHCLENIAAAGITDVGVVAGGHTDQIRAVVGDGSALGLRVSYIYQSAPLGLAHAVATARDFLGDSDFVMYLGDSMLPSGIVGQVQVFRAERPTAEVLLSKVPNPSACGVVELGKDGWVRRLVEKPPRPPSDLALIGVYFLTPAIHDAVRAIRPSGRGELEITDALQWLVEHGHGVRGRVLTSYWKDIGRIEDALECNRVVMEGIQRRISGEVDTASELVGPLVIEAGARITRSTVIGPAIVGAESVINDSVVGPYTSMGARCRLDGSSVEYSIVLDGVSVRQVRDIYASLIGRSAEISLADGGMVRQRLVIGDHAQVEVAR